MSKILLVDDAAFMRMILKTSLTKAGYTNIVEASDGLDAIEVYKKENPDMVFLDITMPNMNGLESLKRIKEYDKSAKIVMCSAMGQETMVVEALKSGAKDFIVKPFKEQRVVNAVKQLIG